MQPRPKPLVLVILDGWGHSHSPEHNAIAQADTPTWNALLRDYPHGLINASELHVGLPQGQMGNSEVGHMNIGSGRVLLQELPRIDAAIANGELAEKLASINITGVTHLMGLASPGGVHSHQNHLIELAKLLSKQGATVKLHLFLDGRDTPPKSAVDYVAAIEQGIASLPNVSIATISGRFYAMDRDKRWDRVEKAYEALANGKGVHAPDAKACIAQNYASAITDEFIEPTIIGDYTGIGDGDSLVMANFRADRVREILGALLDPAFDGFSRSRPVQFSRAVGMNDYSATLAPLMTPLFTPEPLTRIFGEVISEAGLKQLRIAETEKYAHVTFFFNGGREQEFPGESRILVPSPKVATYDLQPEMSASEITAKLVAAIAENTFDVIVVNYANTDMVGHSGNIEAAKKAVEAVDQALSKLVPAVLAKGGSLVITADHGNAEMMHDDKTGQAHTAHTLNRVPILFVANAWKKQSLEIREGKLGDVAPTLLNILGIKQPIEMTGESLLPTHA